MIIEPYIGIRLPMLASLIGTAGVIALLAIAGSTHSPPQAIFVDPMRMAGHAGAAASTRPTTVVKLVSCTPLPDIAGKSITTALVHFPPGGFTPKHRHPGSVTAYVLKGTIRSQLAGEPIGIYSAGGTWFEPPGAVHSFAENSSDTGSADLLAIFVADGKCGPLTIFD